MNIRLYLLAFVMVPTITVAEVNTQTTHISTVWSRLRKDLVFNHFSFIGGPGLFTGGGHRIDAKGEVDRAQPTFHWLQLTIGKKINDNVTVAINPRYIIYYGERPDQRQGEIDDPVTGVLLNYKITENLSYSGIVNTVTGKLSRSARENHLLFNPGDFQELNYRLSNRFDTGLRSVFRINFYGRNENQSAYGGWVGPQLRYHYSDKTKFLTWIEQHFKQEGQNHQYFNTRDEGQHLYFSMIHSMNKSLGFWPYISVNSSDSLAMRNTSIGAMVFGSFL